MPNSITLHLSVAKRRNKESDTAHLQSALLCAAETLEEAHNLSPWSGGVIRFIQITIEAGEDERSFIPITQDDIDELLEGPTAQGLLETLFTKGFEEGMKYRVEELKRQLDQ